MTLPKQVAPLPLYNLRCTVNEEHTEHEFDVKNAHYIHGLKSAIAKVIAGNPTATSFVFVVSAQP